LIIGPKNMISGLKHPWKGYERDLILRMVTPSRGEIILDAGCGTGVFTTHLLETGAGVVGLELSRPMLARALFK